MYLKPTTYTILIKKNDNRSNYSEKEPSYVMLNKIFKIMDSRLFTNICNNYTTIGIHNKISNLLI